MRHGGSRFVPGPPGLAAGSPSHRPERHREGPPGGHRAGGVGSTVPKDRQVRTPGNGGLLRAGRFWVREPGPSALRFAVAARRPSPRRPDDPEGPPILRCAGRPLGDPAAPSRLARERADLFRASVDGSPFRSRRLNACASRVSKPELPATASARFRRLRAFLLLRHRVLGLSAVSRVAPFLRHPKALTKSDSRQAASRGRACG